MCLLNVPLGAPMVFGGFPVPSTGEFGCSASVHNQINYGLFSGKPCAWGWWKLFMTSYDVHRGQRVKREHGDRC